MSNFENEFIDRFKDHESLEGVDSAGVWAAVDASIAAPPAKGAAFYFTRGGLILLALLMIFGGSCIYHQNTSANANGLSQKDAHMKLPLAYSSVSSSEINSSQEALANAQLAKTSKMDNIVKVKQPQTNIPTVNQTAFNSATENSSNSNSSGQNEESHLTQIEANWDKVNKRLINNQFGQETIRHVGDNEKINHISKHHTTPEKSFSDQPLTFDESTIGSNKNLEEKEDGGSTAQIRSQSIQFMRLIKFQGIDNDLTREAIACRGVVNYEKSLPIEAHLLVGINRTNILFDGEESERLSNTQSADFGFSTQLGVTYIKDQKLRFGIGLGYHEWNTKFEETSTSATTFDLDNRIVGFTQDTLGNYTPILGTLTYAGTSKRRVLHHNKVQMISIPLELGYQIPVRRMTLGFNAGISYNLLLAQSGRSLNTNEEYAFYESGGSARPFSKHVIAFHTNLFMDYALREKLKIRFSPQLAYFGAQNGGYYTSKARMINYGLNIGLVWDF